MKVRATQLGFYNQIRRRVGDVFILRAKDGMVASPGGNGFVKKKFTVQDQFSSLWMEKVSDNTKVKTTSAPEALKKENDELKEDRLAHAQTIEDSASAASEAPPVEI